MNDSLQRKLKKEIKQDMYYLSVLNDIKLIFINQYAKEHYTRFILFYAETILYEYHKSFPTDKKGIFFGGTLEYIDFFETYENVLQERDKKMKLSTFDSETIRKQKELIKKAIKESKNKGEFIIRINRQSRVLQFVKEYQDSDKDKKYKEILLQVPKAIYNELEYARGVTVAFTKDNAKVLEQIRPLINLFEDIISVNEDECCIVKKEDVFKTELEEYEISFIIKWYEIVMIMMIFCNIFSTGDLLLGDLKLSDFIRKMKSIIIEALWEDFKVYNRKNQKRELTSQKIIELQNKINRQCKEKFFSVNRKLRNNLHYTYYKALTKKECTLLDEEQNKYLRIIVSFFVEHVDGALNIK